MPKGKKSRAKKSSFEDIQTSDEDSSNGKESESDQEQHLDTSDTGSDKEESDDDSLDEEIIRLVQSVAIEEDPFDEEYLDYDADSEEEVSIYKIKDHPNKSNNSQTFFKRKPSQRSASTYHSIYDSDVGKDKVHYIRNQKDHYFSNIKNSEDNPSKEYEKVKENYLIGTSNPYNFGLDPSFGFEFNHKQVTKDCGTNRPKISRGATKNLQALVDKILLSKNTAVQKIIETVNDTELHTVVVDKHQLAAQYPCVIVRLNGTYAPHASMKKKGTTNEYDAAYSSFLTHLLIAYINYELFKAKVGLFFDRRQSFGFLTPTASDVGPAIRLSPGLVPNKEWLNCVSKGIVKFDTLLQKLWDKKAIENNKNGMGTPHRKFRNGDIDIYAHKLFLLKLLKGDDFIDFISNLDNDYETIKGKVEQSDYFKPLIEQLTGLDTVNVDDNFRTIYTQIYYLYRTLNEKLFPIIDFNTSTTNLMRNLEGSIDKYRRNAVSAVCKLKEIDISSESDCDHEPVRMAGSKDKYYSPAGMGALSNPLFAYANVMSKEIGKVHYYVAPYAYFELASMKTSQKKIKVVGNYKNADIVFADANPCVNTNNPPTAIEKVIETYSKQILPSKQPKLLIVDITSSTQKQIDAIKVAWAKSNIPMLCLARSGIKHMQFSLDLAQYGESSLLINQNYIKKLAGKKKEEATTLEANCKRIAVELAKITKATSSVFATYVRRDIRTKAQQYPCLIFEKTSNRQDDNEQELTSPLP